MTKVKLSLSTTSFEIDLQEEYGIEEGLNWEDLDEDVQNEIKDSIRDNHIVYVDIE